MLNLHFDYLVVDPPHHSALYIRNIHSHLFHMDRNIPEIVVRKLTHSFSIPTIRYSHSSYCHTDSFSYLIYWYHYHLSKKFHGYNCNNLTGHPHNFRNISPRKNIYLAFLNYYNSICCKARLRCQQHILYHHPAIHNMMLLHTFLCQVYHTFLLFYLENICYNYKNHPIVNPYHISAFDILDPLIY